MSGQRITTQHTMKHRHPTHRHDKEKQTEDNDEKLPKTSPPTKWGDITLNELGQKDKLRDKGQYQGPNLY